MDEPSWRPASRAVHLGRPPRQPGGPLNPSVVLSSTFHQGADLGYGREGNPTWTAFEEAVGGLEGGYATAFASGLGAAAAVLELLPLGGRVVVAEDAYQGSRALLARLAEGGRLSVRSAPVADTEATLARCAEVAQTPGRPHGSGEGWGGGGLLWLESPTNPLLAVADLAALCRGAHELGLVVAVDNTLATPLVQRPLELGADVVVHSATKHLAGHSDVLMGVTVSADQALAASLATVRTLHGAIPGPFEAWLALRGLRTLALRVERSQANAGELAHRLATHPAVERVRYPGLPDDPGHPRAQRQMDGFGSMVSFDVAGGAEAADAVAAACRLITIATSLGGVESLMERRGRYPGERSLPGGLLRLSVGIEDVDDLWDDLTGALAQVSG
jgi:cystathionine gamma-synthase